jgi:hypothetical protein
MAAGKQRIGQLRIARLILWTVRNVVQIIGVRFYTFEEVLIRLHRFGHTVAKPDTAFTPGFEGLRTQNPREHRPTDNSSSDTVRTRLVFDPTKLNLTH